MADPLVDAGAVQTGPSDEVREIFTLKAMKERVWRLEAENKELKVNNNILVTQYTSQCETQSDILRTLHANLDENYSKIEELENRIHGPMGYEQQLDDLKQASKDDLEAQKTQWEAKVGELILKNEYLDTELHSVAEFREKRAEMEAELTTLRQQLKDQAAQHAKDVSAFDRKKAIEIDQLKKDMHRSIKETREMLKNRTKDQLDTTTKRTIMENEQMATELHFQSKQTEQLLEKNQSLVEENAQLRRNLVLKLGGLPEELPADGACLSNFRTPRPGIICGRPDNGEFACTPARMSAQRPFCGLKSNSREPSPSSFPDAASPPSCAESGPS